MTSSGSGLLVKPAWRSVPNAATSAGEEAVELAASAGLILDAWQQAAVVDLLGEDAGGFWSATSGGLICPRQNGKGAVLEALELAWLFLFDVSLIFHSAHLFATSQDAFRRIKTLIKNTPDLDGQVLRYSEAHGQEGIELHTGQRLRFVARSKSGGRGFPAPVVVLDEAFNLSAAAMQALVPTMAAQNNPFLLITSSAPIDDPCSDVLRSFMSRSRTGEVDRRCYVEYAAQPGDPLQRQIQDANPGYGVRLNDDVIAEERELLTEKAFEVERLGIVDLTEGAAHWLILPRDAWTACERVGHRPSGDLTYAVDADVNRSGETWVSIGCSDGSHIELVTPPEAGSGTAWAVQAIIKRRAEVGELVIDPYGPAGVLVAPLEAANIPLKKLTGAEVASASAQFLEAVTQNSLRHIDQPRLDTAAAGVERRDVGDGAWRFSRTRSAVDISPLLACCFARFGALAQRQAVPAGFKTLDDLED